MFGLIPQRTLEGRCCLLSSCQLLALTAGKAGSGRALLWAAPKKHREGAGGRERGWDKQTGRHEQIDETEVKIHHRTLRQRGLCSWDFSIFSSWLNVITHSDPPALQPKKMPKSPPCAFPWSSMWLASLATLMVQSVLSSSYSSSSSSSSTYQRSAADGKRPGFMERTLILLDVNTRSPLRVLNENFLSLQLDPSIIKDGWLDFLRYRTASVYPKPDLYRCL